MKIEKYFDKDVMSVHLKEKQKPSVKRGMPGKWKFEELKFNVLKSNDLVEIHEDLVEEVNANQNGFIEMEREGSTIFQIENYRIVVTKPPFSNCWEITCVRPIKKLALKDYKLSEKLKNRIAEQAEGILICGSPGMGKSCFASALAEYYSEHGRIVKTIEAPRDLQLSDKIVQYALKDNAEEIHDVLLLSRPDYTIFDEIRNYKDFELFSDLRLSGIGLAGVVHATNPIDAIQRFIGKTELGVIPHIIDTVIFIKDGKVDEILSLEITVKVPSGMTEDDLARPIVVVKDFETGKLEFEIYSYGEETVVVPVKELDKKKRVGAHELAARQIEDYLIDYRIKARVVSDNKAEIYVPSKFIAKIIGKGGKKIGLLEKELGIKLEVKEG